MKTIDGTCIDVIEASVNLPPLEMQLQGDITLLQMDHGAFKLRVHTPDKTIVTLNLDGQVVLTTKVEPGIHVLTQTDNSQSLEFKPAAVNVIDATDDGEPPYRPAIDVDGVEEEQSSYTRRKPFLGNGGRLHVTLSHYREDHGATVTEHVFLTETRVFQFNTAADHDRAIVENLHRFVPTSDDSSKPVALCGCCRVTS